MNRNDLRRHVMFQPQQQSPASTDDLTEAQEGYIKVTDDYNLIVSELHDIERGINKYQQKLKNEISGDKIKLYNSKILKLEKKKPNLQSLEKELATKITAVEEKITNLCKERGIQLDWDSPSAIYGR